jgi:hypothetical protein
VWREQLRAHDLPKRAPARGVGHPDHGGASVIDDGVRHGSGRERSVMLLKEFARDLWGGDDLLIHEGSMGFGEVSEGAVWLLAEEVETADERQRARPWREVKTDMYEEVEEADGEEGEQKPWQPQEERCHICMLCARLVKSRWCAAFLLCFHEMCLCLIVSICLFWQVKIVFFPCFSVLSSCVSVFPQDWCAAVEDSVSPTLIMWFLSPFLSPPSICCSFVLNFTFLIDALLFFHI